MIGRARHVTATSAPSRTTPSWGRRLVGIEGLRGAAAISVIVGHVHLYSESPVDLGPFDRVLSALDGLTLFFALSGFLLYRPFAAAIVSPPPGPPRPRAGDFFRNRALRIYPAYVVILVLASFLLQTTNVVAASEPGFENWRAVVGPPESPWVFLTDLTMLQTLVPDTMLTGLGVAWSLTTELFFYLALPLLAAAATWLARRTSKRVAVVLVPAVLLVTGVAGKAIIAATTASTPSEDRYAHGWGPTWQAVFERSLLAHADLFGWGALAAVVFVLLERELLPATTLQRVRTGAVAGFLVGGALTVAPSLLGPLGSQPWRDSVTAAACAALIVWATLPTRLGRPSLMGRALELRPLVFAGLASYSAYLWHLPVIWWLVIHGWTFPSTPLGYGGSVALVLAVTYALAAVTYYLVEAPALKLKRRTDGGKATAAGPPTAGAIVHTPTGPDAVVPAAPRE